ncbi:MAG: hypothetical protein ABIP13_10280 [Tepidiformaceae bacterium]
MLLRTTALLVGAMLIFSACESNRSYPEKGDAEYDLKAMALTASDLPAGFTEQELGEDDFDNEAWAEFYGVDDVEAKKAQLDAQKRVRSRVSTFQPKELGKLFRITAISTLYENNQSATDSAAKFACGLPIDDKEPLSPFAVPTIGDAANGFFVDTQTESGLRLIDTTICFRTGRVLHSVQQTGLPGTEDVALAVRLAEKMRDHTDAFFDGRAPIPTASPSRP